MPIYKYKTFEEAERALWNINPDKEYFNRVAELWDFAYKLCPMSYLKGIFKFKTIEEANKHREDIEIAYAKRLRVEKRKARNSDYSV